MEDRIAMFSVFAGSRLLVRGRLGEAALAAKSAIESGTDENVVIFEDQTGEVVEVDYRGTPGEVLDRLGVEARPAEAVRGPGRPRLGVVGREVTLLPRHWDWLNEQPGGASVALRKLVEAARRTHAGRDRARRAQNAAYQFMCAMAGDEPGYEEALRAFFANDADRFDEQVVGWPTDVRDHARRLAELSFRAAREATDQPAAPG